MSEEHEKIVFIATHAGEDPERATFPCCWPMRPRPWMWRRWWCCRGTGCILAQKGYADKISFPGLTPLKQLVENYVANGGTFLC